MHCKLCTHPGSPSAPTRARFTPAPFTCTLTPTLPRARLSAVQRSSSAVGLHAPPRAAARLRHCTITDLTHSTDSQAPRDPAASARATALDACSPVPAELSPHTHHPVSTHLFTVTCAMHEAQCLTTPLRTITPLRQCHAHPRHHHRRLHARGPCPARPPPDPFSFIVSAELLHRRPVCACGPDGGGTASVQTSAARDAATHMLHCHRPPTRTPACTVPTAPVAYAVE